MMNENDLKNDVAYLSGIIAILVLRAGGKVELGYQEMVQLFDEVHTIEFKREFNQPLVITVAEKAKADSQRG